MFITPQPTEYDLRFSLFGVPVRVSGWFWLIGVMLGFETVKIGVEYLLVWLSVLFFSILVHEFGHALMAMAFGYRPRVLLYHFGGLAMYEPDASYTAGRSVAISLAGPGAGFGLYGLTLAFRIMIFPQLVSGLPQSVSTLIWFAIIQLEWINLYWGLVNLLPVLPLDGGRVSQEICLKFSPRNGITYAAQTGALVSGAAAAWFFTQEMYYPAFLFGWLCASNITMAQQRRW